MAIFYDSIVNIPALFIIIYGWFKKFGNTTYFRRTHFFFGAILAQTQPHLLFLVRYSKQKYEVPAMEYQYLMYQVLTLFSYQLQREN